MPCPEASLTNRNDIIVDTIIADKVLANQLPYLDNTYDDVDIEDLYVKYEDIATSHQESVPVGGGISQIQVKFNEEDITDDKIPGLASLLEYLKNNYQAKNTSTSNQTASTKHKNYTNQGPNSKFTKLQ